MWGAWYNAGLVYFISMTAPIVSRAWPSHVATCIVFLLPALVLTTRLGIGLVEFAVLAGALYYARPMWTRRHELFGPSQPIGMAFLLSFVVATASLAWSGFEPRFFENPGKQLLAVTVVALVTLTRPKEAWFWPGVFVGAIGSAILASYQRFGLDIPRAEGFHMAIMFGDIAMALGLMALASIERFAGTRWALIPFVAFLSGAAASVMSGSRGGWIALLFSFVPLYSYGRSAMRRRIVILVAVSAALFIGGYFVPESNIRQRVAEAVTEISRYEAHGSADTSVGARLEMWKGAWKMFVEHPVFGVGRANYHDALGHLIDRGEISADVRDFHHAHNEMLNSLATEGLLGGLTLAFLYAAPIMFFMRRLRRDDASKPYALAGLLLALSFIDFGLTQVLFAHHVGSGFYALTVCLLAGFCVSLERTEGGIRTEARDVQSLDA
jgi:O-antigen ligase